MFRPPHGGHRQVVHTKVGKLLQLVTAKTNECYGVRDLDIKLYLPILLFCQL
jgi:hypothetical protein